MEIEEAKNTILQGDCIEEMKKLPDNSVDAVVTDPPYGLNFMGKEWDNYTDNEALQEWTEKWAKECLRVLKPGGHLLSFGGTRTMHRITSGIEDAGFDVRDKIQWVYHSGFPKSHNIGKAVDKKLGNEREILPPKQFPDGTFQRKTARAGIYSKEKGQAENSKGNTQWEGFGTALKPAHEPIVLARAPLEENTIVNQVLETGTGGLDIDGCRIPIKDIKEYDFNRRGGTERSTLEKGDLVTKDKVYDGGWKKGETPEMPQGRFPANVICQDDALNDGEITKSNDTKRNRKTIGSFGMPNDETSEYSDSGSKSRFFDLDLWAKKNGILQIPKPSKSEKNRGCEGLEEKSYEGRFNNAGEWKDMEVLVGKNNHPTCKPIKLMSWLIKLVSKEDDIVLDPFLGSGTTACACVLQNRNYIGIEQNEEYIKIAKARIKYWKMPKNRRKAYDKKVKRKEKAEEEGLTKLDSFTK